MARIDESIEPCLRFHHVCGSLREIAVQKRGSSVISRGGEFRRACEIGPMILQCVVFMTALRDVALLNQFGLDGLSAHVPKPPAGGAGM
jgi:hypothetical protein